MPYVGGKPSIEFSELINRKAKGDMPFPLRRDNCSFYFSGRYALAAGLEALDLRKEDSVLVPSYNCGAEVDPVVRSGRKAIFYRIGRNFRIDLDDLKKRIRAHVRAILVTHFLGFPQPIEELEAICQERGIYLIEDCAHAFLSSSDGRPLGSRGDMAIFSLLKTLPVPNGGALVINNNKINHRWEPIKPNSFAVFFYGAQLMRLKTRPKQESTAAKFSAYLSKAGYDILMVIRYLLAGYRKFIHHPGLYLVKPDSQEFVEDICRWGMSSFSWRIIRGTDFEKIKEKRRWNFEYLLSKLIPKEGRWVLPIRNLPPGVCPLFFPLLLESKQKRDSVYPAMKSRGVTTHPWWDRFHPAVPWEDFPEAVYLKNHLLGLPCHQDLGPDDLDLVIDEFQRALDQP